MCFCFGWVVDWWSDLSFELMLVVFFLLFFLLAVVVVFKSMVERFTNLK
jgi:hypothetical protein